MNQVEFWAWVRWGVVFIPVLYLIFKSRQWTEPARAVRLEAVEDDIKILRGNLHRLDRDVEAWRREMSDANEQIIKRLDAIQRNGAHEHPLVEKIEALTERILDVEQSISGLPCGQMATVACPKETK